MSYFTPPPTKSSNLFYSVFVNLWKGMISFFTPLWVTDPAFLLLRVTGFHNNVRNGIAPLPASNQLALIPTSESRKMYKSISGISTSVFPKSFQINAYTALTVHTVMLHCCRMILANSCRNTFFQWMNEWMMFLLTCDKKLTKSQLNPTHASN